MSTASITSSISAPTSSTARAADGDYKTKGVGHEVKDADGDYKQTAKTSALQVSSTAAAAVTSSNTVRGALLDLPKGGA